MDCPRCQGFMVESTFEDLQNDTGTFSVISWRCINCGGVWDPVVAIHRETRPLPFRTSFPRLKGRVRSR
ncbi:MAG: hypothetical protein ACREI3_12790 [Nitrospirales bacterium]